MDHKLDNIDRKIIEMLQKNARTPVKEIAKEVFLSSPAVSARIEHLEKTGLITGYHAQVNPVFLGYHIKAFINLEVEPYQKKDFYPFIQATVSYTHLDVYKRQIHCISHQFHAHLKFGRIPLIPFIHKPRITADLPKPCDLCKDLQF